MSLETGTKINNNWTNLSLDIFTLVYFVEMLLKIFAYGYINNLDFIFTGPNSKNLCEELERLLKDSNIGEDQLLS